MIERGAEMAATLPDGQHQVLEGQTHAADPEVVAPAVAAFV